MVEWVEGNREVTRYNNSIHGTSAAVVLYWNACLDCRKPEIGSGVRVSVVMETFRIISSLTTLPCVFSVFLFFHRRRTVISVISVRSEIYDEKIFWTW